MCVCRFPVGYDGNGVGGTTGWRKIQVGCPKGWTGWVWVGPGFSRFGLTWALKLPIKNRILPPKLYGLNSLSGG